MSQGERLLVERMVLGPFDTQEKAAAAVETWMRQAKNGDYYAHGIKQAVTGLWKAEIFYFPEL